MQNPFITSTQEGFNFVKYAKNLTEVLGKGAGDALHRSLSGNQTDMITSLIDAHKDVVAANGIDATIDVVAKLITKSHYTEPTIYFSMLLIADLYITALLNQKTLSECKENPHVLNEELKDYVANPIPIIKEKESLPYTDAGKYVGPVYDLAKALYGDVIASQIMEIGHRAVNFNEVDESPYYILDGLMSVDTPAYNTLSAVRKHQISLFKERMTRIRSLTKGLDLIYEASSYRELLYRKLIDAGFYRTDAKHVLVIVSDVTGIGFAGKHHLGISPDEIVAGIVAGPTSDAFVFVYETFRKYHLLTDNEFKAMWDSLLRYGPQHTNDDGFRL